MQSGITLVSLVITIIILLILAGVAINMAVNSAGLFGHANTAVTRWNQSVTNEEETLQNLIAKAEVAINGGGTTPDIPPEWDESKVEDVVTETSEVTGVTKQRKVPVPTGFVASKVSGENTIAGGLVIYEGAEEVNSSNHATAMTTRNQYVWIPVDDINQMVMGKKNYIDATEASICHLVLQADGTLKCETHNSEELCGRLYNTGNSMDFTDRTQTWTENSGDQEPNIVSAKDTDATTGNLATFTANMINDFNAMAKSVATYGGFYVSRYEVGAGGSSKQGQTVLTAAGGSANKWYGLYNTLRGTNKHMIWGSQYDQIISFIGTEAQTIHLASQQREEQVSGYTGDTDILKNIYDLEGNFSEWTAQGKDTNNRIYRGGCAYGVVGGLQWDASKSR